MDFMPWLKERKAMKSLFTVHPSSFGVMRTFHPIGQGAFFSEEFVNESGVCMFRIVYDCGSSKFCKLQPQSDGQKLARSDIEERVREAFSDDDAIDMLFISHFDDDHVNLISQLKPFNNRKIRTVVLPLLSEEDRCVLTGHFRCAGLDATEDLMRIIQDPRAFFNRCERVAFVQPLDERENHGADRRGSDQRYRGIEELPENIPSLSEIVCSFPFSLNALKLEWVFVPYNHKPERIEDLKAKLRGSLGEDFDFTKLNDADFVIENLETLRTCYNDIPRDINSNSMALYSGPLNGGMWHENEILTADGKCWSACYLDQLWEYCLDCGQSRADPIAVANRSSCFRRPGCLYTGDISLNEARLSAKYAKYEEGLGFVQIPHHASQNSFGNGDLPISRRMCIATYGERNVYGHPALLVKRAVGKNEGLWIDVTELRESMFRVKFSPVGVKCCV